MEEKMTLSELCIEVLELEKKAMHGPWVFGPVEQADYEDEVEVFSVPDDILVCDNCHYYPHSVSHANMKLIAHYRTACVKLALAAQRMEEALRLCVSTNQAQDHAMRALADVQKIVEGE